MTRRILFCTIGATPQVVTETVWALGRQEPPWIPDAIQVVTTGFKLSYVSESLQGRDCPLSRLFDKELPSVAIHVPRRDGSAYEARTDAAEPVVPDDLLQDVNTEQDAALMGNLILRLIAQFAADPDTELHVSLAGGRKTMSAHALMALSLVGRPRDRATHVLVDPPFEGHPDFWHPDQGGLLVTMADLHKNPQPVPSVSPADANVVLVPTPAPLMRHRMAKAQMSGSLDLIELVNHVNIAAALSENPHVVLDVAANSVRAGGIIIALGPKLFAVYRLLAEAKRKAWPGAGPNGVGPHQAGWLTFEEVARGNTPDGQPIRDWMENCIRDSETAGGGDPWDPKSLTQIWRKVCSQQNDIDRTREVRDLLNPNVTNLEVAFREKIGFDAAVILAPAREFAKRNAARFGLLIPSDGIEIK